MIALLQDLLGPLAEARIAESGKPFETLTESGSRPLVLFGAGQMGRAVRAALARKGVEVLCFTDNDPTRWGRIIDGLPVLSPRAAAEAHGAEAVFVPTFQGDASTLARLEVRLENLGVRTVCPFPILLRRWPETSGWPCGEPGLYREHGSELEEIHTLLADDTSRLQFLGHLSWRLARDPGALPTGSSQDQYFCPELVHMREDECFVDGGAYNGDTLRTFLQHGCEAFGWIHAFEPDPSSYEELRSFLANLPSGISRRITPYDAALGLESRSVLFEAQGNHLSTIGTGEGGILIPTLALDSLQGEIPVSFIKMDLEGSERPALEGARETISRDRPILAISVYHHPSDLFELPLLLRRLCRNYKFHLRTHNRFGLDIVLYAIPEERSR